MKNKRISILCWILIFVFLFVSIWSNHVFTKRKLKSDQPLYIFPKSTIKFLSFGFDNLFADAYYIWMFQFFSTYEIHERIVYLKGIIEAIGKLDPNFSQPFSMAALIAYIQAKDVELALEILNIGLRYQPDEWMLSYEAGYYLKSIKKYKRAFFFYDIAAHRENSPDALKKHVAHLAHKTGELQEAYNFWLNIHKNSKKDYEKKVSYHHLYHLTYRMDKKNLDKIIEKFKKIYGRYPSSLRELVRKGFIRSVPTDYDGEEYIYNPKTGDIKPKKRFFWK